MHAPAYYTPPLPGSYVIAIDIGIMNLGLCIFDFNTQKIVLWDRCNLTSGNRYVPSNNCLYVRQFLQRYDLFFKHCYALILERQIRCNMRIIEAVLQMLFYERCHVISARSVKVHFNISTKNYRGNKAKAVEWTHAFLNENSHVFADQVKEVFVDHSKRDDLADSLLLLMFYLDTYSNQMANLVHTTPVNLDEPEAVAAD